MMEPGRLGDDRLRDAFRSLSAGAVFGDGCPPPDRIWDGARGHLSPPEIAALTDHIVVCGACAAAWREAMSFGGAMPASPASRPMWWWAAAASVVIAAGAATIWWSRTGPGVASPPRVESTLPPVTAPVLRIAVEAPAVRVSAARGLLWRGQPDGQAFLEELAAALDPYRAGRFAEAMAPLQRLASARPDATEPWFYLGASALMAGRAVDAIPALEAARRLADPAFADEAAWLLAAALERSGRRDDARRELQTMCAGAGTYRARACDVVTSFDGPSGK